MNWIEFGSGKKLTLYYDGIQIQTTETHKYLGTTLDSTLSLSTNFEKMYKKTTAKLHMMYSLCSYLDQHSKIKVFRGMILPWITYNCTVNLDLNLTQRKKLQTINRLATNVIGSRQPSVKNEIKKRSIILAQKCAEKDTWKNFKDYFNIVSHDRETRNNGYSLQIPNTKLKYPKCGFFSLGATLCNALPIQIRKIDDFNIFRENFLNYIWKQS